MFLFQRRGKVHFNIATLKKNDISILTLDERWNKLFKMIPVNREIKKCQDYLNGLLGREAALFQEKKSIEPEKKKHMGNIIALTQEAFEKNNMEAKKTLSESKKSIEALNQRARDIENELFVMKDKIRDANFSLLEETIRYVYTIMVKSKEKERRLEKELERLKIKLKELQNRRQGITTDWTDVYAFFHTLLGAEELTRLDQLFLKPEVEPNEAGDSQRDEKN